MIHIQVKRTIDDIIDLYYNAENIEIIKIKTDKYNMKKLWIDNTLMFEDAFDIIVEEI